MRASPLQPKVCEIKLKIWLKQGMVVSILPQSGSRNMKAAAVAGFVIYALFVLYISYSSSILVGSSTKELSVLFIKPEP